MKKNDKDHKGDNILKRLNLVRRTFLKGLIATGVGALSGDLFRPTSVMALGGSTMQKSGDFIVEQTK